MFLHTSKISVFKEMMPYINNMHVGYVTFTNQTAEFGLK